MSQTKPDISRAAFEAEAPKHNITIERFKQRPDSYKFEYTISMFKLWQAAWDAAIASQQRPVSEPAESKLSDYDPSQWWLTELENHWGRGESTGDTRRAAKVACNFAALVFARSEPAVKYTCVGKGGEYDLVGTAKGAGQCRDNLALTVYRDTVTGALYYRTEDDFAERMSVIPATVKTAGLK